MDFPQLAEPKTLADLDQVIAQRNASFRESNSRSIHPLKESEVKKLMMTRDNVLHELELVRDDEPSSPGAIRNFLGGIGLIVRRGFDDAITGAGLALLRSVAPAKRAA